MIRFNSMMVGASALALSLGMTDFLTSREPRMGPGQNPHRAKGGAGPRPAGGGAKECAKRRDKIARGQLRVENGLAAS